MPVVSLHHFLLQLLLGFGSCLLLWLIGHAAISFIQEERKPGERYASVFYPMLAGFLLLITSYAILETGGKTVFILLLPAFAFCWWKQRKIKRPPLSFRPVFKPALLAELLLISLFFCLLFNFLPESVYKQQDSFFYLKITESLHQSGQEKLHQAYNQLTPRYHGVEPYHYMELWLAAFQLNLAEKWLPGIQVLRVAAYTPIAAMFIFGLFYLFELFTGKTPGLLSKLVCMAFVFFMPDVFEILP
ncbi:MAG: hypothetical protein JST39_13650, partial [Bacteroidetes bacterium]|nr:hypothetical protein [Bacteroidota bacterium]